MESRFLHGEDEMTPSFETSRKPRGLPSKDGEPKGLLLMM